MAPLVPLQDLDAMDIDDNSRPESETAKVLRKTVKELKKVRAELAATRTALNSLQKDKNADKEV